MSKKNIISSSLIALILVGWISSVEPVQAAFVPCDGVDCSLCNLVDMINLIILWLFGIIFLIFAVIMLVAGFGLITAGGNQTALDEAKKKFQNAVIGIIIVMAAWLLIDTIMKGLLTDGEISGYGPWTDVQCQQQTVPIEHGELGYAGGTPPDPNITAECTDDAALMAKYKGSPVGVEAPGLRKMINCYRADQNIEKVLDTNQIFTVDRTHERCSLTNGNPVCGPCSHSNNSMHYGRGSGQGARAVDFNARGVSESTLFGLIRERQKVCGGTLNYENSHTHISL
ncbi:MAG: hypothetical protein H6779_04850 [Candidatus Nomurabacteria bacterium]|nr:hypothetical protein [Candidatus Nomurabacteria bacterium]USN87698.1 MAG: hypothetical protein H6779_04850 [Candidatus Nomurabacteria bacterium]